MKPRSGYESESGYKSAGGYKSDIGYKTEGSMTKEQKDIMMKERALRYSLKELKPPIIESIPQEVKTEVVINKPTKQEKVKIKNINKITNKISQIEDNIKKLKIEREITEEYGRKTRIDTETRTLSKNKRKLKDKLKELNK